MAISKMTPEQEAGITKLLGPMNAMVQEGVHPTDALYKVASEHQMQAGHVRLMANAYNTGRTLYQMQEGEHLLDKLAEFPLADAAEVLERMYPSQHKTAAEQFHSTAISPDYALPPHYWVEREKLAEKRAAACEIDLRSGYARLDGHETPPEPFEYPEEPGRNIKRALDRKRDLIRERDESNYKFHGTQYAALESIRNLVGYFKQAGSLPWAAVRENAVAVHGDRAAKLMDKVAEFLGQEEARFGPLDMRRAYREMDTVAAKQASLAMAKEAAAADPVPSIWDPAPEPEPTFVPPVRQTVKTAVDRQHLVHWDQAPYSLITTCFDACATAVAARVAHEVFEKEANEEIVNSMRPFVETATENSAIYGSVWDAVLQTAEEKVASILPFAAGSAVGGYAKGLAEKATQRYDTQLDKTVGQLAENDDNLRAIQTQSMLHDLMQNDPVVSGYGHEQVIDAYNRLSDISPRALQHRLIAQSMLRKYLEQSTAVDPFDVDQLLGVEKKLTDRDARFKQPQTTG